MQGRTYIQITSDGTGTRWARYDLDHDPVEPIAQGGPFRNDADCYDAMVEDNPDYRRVGVTFGDLASRSEGTGEHVKAPVVGFPVGPGRWSTVDPQALPDA
jgi:hypothetical protein